jgi:hypothetical protein
MYSGYITPKNEQAAYRRTALSYNPSAAQHGLQATGLGSGSSSESLLCRPAPEPNRSAA